MHKFDARNEALGKVLVVCVGNVCRSPTAEVVLRHRVPGLVVSSAGLSALSGSPIDPTAQRVLAAHGLDGSRHVARQLHHGLIHDADLILAMERAQVDALQQEVPAAHERVFLLDHWGEREDIADPFQQPRSAFEDAYLRIDAAVQAWLPHLAGSRNART